MLLDILIKYSFSLKRDTCCLQTEQNRTQAVYNRETNDLQLADTVIEGWLMLTRKICQEFLFIRQSGWPVKPFKSIYFHLKLRKSRWYRIFNIGTIESNWSIFRYRKRNQNFRNRNLELNAFEKLIRFFQVKSSILEKYCQKSSF